MIYFRRPILIICLLLVQATARVGAIERYRFSNLSLDDGLSQITAICIHQDAQGYMWFGTRNGLNRYDGYGFESFLAEHDDPSTISDNHILEIAEGKGDYLWVGTYKGLNRMNCSDESFRRYLPDPDDPGSIPGPMVAALLVDNRGTLWVGTNNGLCRYIPESDSFERITLLDGVLSSNRINDIVRDDDGRLFLATSTGGVVIYDDDGGTYEVLRHDPADPRSIAHNFVRSILIDRNGNLWLGTGGGVSMRREGDRDFETIATRDGLSDNQIRQIVESPQGYLVIATNDGMNVIDPATGAFDRYVTYGGDKGNLSHYSVFCLYFDRAQTLWVGTYGGGVDYHNQYAQRFDFNDLGQAEHGLLGLIGGMVEGKDHLYLATEGSGLVEMDKQGRTIRNYMIHDTDRRSYVGNIVKSLYMDGDKLLCGTNAGTIWAFDVNTRHFSPMYDMQVLDPIYYIGRDSRGNLLVGMVDDLKGLISISPDGRITESFPTADGTSVTFGNVRCVLELTPGRLLIGTRNNGMYDYDTATGQLIQYTDKGDVSRRSLPNNYVSSLFRDSRGDVWVGTFGGGISRFDPDAGSFDTFNVDSGLPSGMICAVTEERSGNLWISTISGISEFDPSTGSFTNYTRANGIRIGEFSPHSVLRLSDDRIVFGGNNGIVSFSPDFMFRNPAVPPVVIRNLYIDNVRIVPGDDTGILDKIAGRQSHIVLRHDQTNLSIEYSALNYIFSERNQYRYRLDGFDGSWNEVGERRIAYYTNIPPGRYRFEVMGSNNDVAWNPAPVGIDITVLPPLWLRWWAIALYLIVFVLMLNFIIRWFGEKRRLENDIKLKQAEAKAREEFHVERSRLFTNFSHELRTPLTLIMSPLSNIVETETALSEQTRSNLLLMQDNADRMLRIVNNLMDFQKRESGKLTLKVAEGDFAEFARRTTMAFSQFAASRGVELLPVCECGQIALWFDHRLMEKVFFNYLSNAFKNVTTGGRVEVRVRRMTLAELRESVGLRAENFTDPEIEYILLEIADTGAGIPADELERIFTPFYQVARNEHSVSGTGLGLSLSRSIIEMHHGVIWAESPEGSGAIFRTILPIDRRLFAPEEIAPATDYETVTPTVIPVSAGEEKGGSVGKYTILVVEDNADVRRYITASLGERYTVHEASNGADALDKALYHMPDLVISDVMMPRMDGMEMTARLKEDLRTSHIPVILITAKAMSDDIREGYHAGADAYIVKPFSSSVLVARVENLLASRERLKAIYGKRFSLESLGVDAVSADERFLTGIYEVLERRVADPKFNLDMLNREMGMSRANLYRKMKAVTNLSPNEFIRNFRLEMGAKMLRETDMSVSDIFVAVGFSSLAYFSNCFKTLYGITPSEYAAGGANRGDFTKQ